MKKITLSIKERAILCDLMPQQGTKLQQIIVRGLLNKFKFTEDELEKHKIKYTEGAMSWSRESDDLLFDFEISDVELNVIKEASEDTSKSGRVTQHNLSLIEKIDSL